MIGDLLSDLLSGVVAELLETMTPGMWGLTAAVLICCAWVLWAFRQVAREERGRRQHRPHARRAAPPRIPVEAVRPAPVAPVAAPTNRERPHCPCSRCQHARDERLRRAVERERALIIHTGETNPRRAWAMVGGPRV